MSQLNLTTQAIDNLMAFVDAVAPEFLKTVTGAGKYTDINKKVGGMRMDLYGVYSNNIPDQTMNKVREVLETKYIGVLNELLNEIVIKAHSAGNDPVAAVRDRLSNKGYHVSLNNNELADKINMSESAQDQIKNLISRVAFNGKSLQGTALTEAKDSGFAPNGHTVPTTIDMQFGAPAMDYSKKKFGGQIARNSDGSPAMREMSGKVPFTVNVSLMNVEADKVVEIVGTSRERTNLFNYIRMRAGVGSFFKDFLLNLKEIDKQVERETSQNLTDRLLGSMVRSGGLINPMKLSDLAEAKYYLMVLEQTDVDTLRAKHDFNLNKPNALHTLFSTFNILSLVIVDTTKKNMRMYDSDNPLKSSIYNYDSGSSPDQMASLFAALARK